MIHHCSFDVNFLIPNDVELMMNFNLHFLIVNNEFMWLFNIYSFSLMNCLLRQEVPWFGSWNQAGFKPLPSLTLKTITSGSMRLFFGHPSGNTQLRSWLQAVKLACLESSKLAHSWETPYCKLCSMEESDCSLHHNWVFIFQNMGYQLNLIQMFL
jgi:hypothetical protein